MILKRIVDTVYPRICFVCGECLVGNEEYVCADCLAKMSRTGFADNPDNGVVRRLAGLVPFERASAIFFYNRGNDISSVIHDFKYHTYPNLARRFGRLMYEELTFTDFFTGIDMIVPVPLHWLRTLRRGYNQSEMLALGIADHARLPVRKLLKARMHVSQTRRSLAQRRNNPKGKYFAVDAPDIIDQHLLIVDDVCTTGSTLLEVAKTLTDAFPNVKVSMLTLAATV